MKLETLTMQAAPPTTDSQYQRRSLFLRDKDYRIADLQEHLKGQGVMSVLVDGRLSTSANKLQVYFDKAGQLRFEGLLCKEYFIVRSLVYQHFGRI